MAACKPEQACENLLGGFRCTGGTPCKDGYQLLYNGTCAGRRGQPLALLNNSASASLRCGRVQAGPVRVRAGGGVSERGRGLHLPPRLPPWLPANRAGRGLRGRGRVPGGDPLRPREALPQHPRGLPLPLPPRLPRGCRRRRALHQFPFPPASCLLPPPLPSGLTEETGLDVGVVTLEPRQGDAYPPFATDEEDGLRFAHAGAPLSACQPGFFWDGQACSGSLSAPLSRCPFPYEHRTPKRFVRCGRVCSVPPVRRGVPQHGRLLSLSLPRRLPPESRRRRLHRLGELALKKSPMK